MHLAGELLGVDLQQARGVLGVKTVTPVPGTPRALLGVTNIRGVVVPLIDLRVLLHFPPATGTEGLAVVIRREAALVAVLVDRIPEIHSVPREEVQPVDEGESGARAWWTTATLPVGARMVRVLNIDAIMARLEADV